MSSRTSVRRHLIAGLIVIAPVTATAFVLWWIFQLLDGLLGRFLYPFLGNLFGRDTVVIPGLGLLVLFLLLVGIGWAAQRAIGSRIISWWHDTLERLPLTRRIYTAANRMVRTVFATDDARPFKKVVLVSYPADGRYMLGFLSGPAPIAVLKHVPGAVSVFIPTSPNPTSGFLVIIPPALLHEVDLTVDEAFTYILSGGAVVPESTAAALVASGAAAFSRPAPPATPQPAP
jgi:uncharacterized membrane protein